MLYLGAGPSGKPGIIDAAIAELTAGAGLILDSSSKGISLYGQYDEVSRDAGDWELTLGNVEFSPLHNLAKYGWEEYKKDPTGARNLGWPLHAIGDALAPHHTVGTTSYGHRPYEEAAASVEPSANTDAILLSAFNAYSTLSVTKDVPTFIIESAVWTSDHVAAQGDWPFDDEASRLYHFPPELGGNQSQAIARYDSYKPLIQELLDEAVGRATAILLVAASLAKPTAPHSQCASGQHYNATLGKCVAGVQATCPKPCAKAGGSCAFAGDCCLGFSCSPSGQCEEACLSAGLSCLGTGFCCAGLKCQPGADGSSTCSACAPDGQPCGPGGGGCCHACDLQTNKCAFKP